MFLFCSFNATELQSQSNISTNPLFLTPLFYFHRLQSIDNDIIVAVFQSIICNKWPQIELCKEYQAQVYYYYSYLLILGKYANISTFLQIFLLVMFNHSFSHLVWEYTITISGDTAAYDLLQGSNYYRNVTIL